MYQYDSMVKNKEFVSMGANNIIEEHDRLEG